MKNLIIVFLIAICKLTEAQISNWQWAQSVGSTGNDFSNSVAVSSSGQVYLTGALSGSISFDSNVIATNGGSDVFIAGYNNHGVPLWAINAGGSMNDEGKMVTTDDEGNIYVVGYFESASITFGITILTNASNGGSSDMFIAKFDSSGNTLWAKKAGGNSFDAYYACASDPSGNGDVYVAGYFSSDSIIVGLDTLINSGNTDLIVTKYDVNGNVVWTKNGGSTFTAGGCSANSIAVDSAGQVYVAGGFSNILVFGQDTLAISAGGSNMFLLKLDNNGNPLWAKKAEAAGVLAQANSVAVDSYGHIYLGGQFSGSFLVFGTDTLTQAGSPNYPDVFLVKYDPNGNPSWARKGGGNNVDISKSITIDPLGNIFVGGYFFSSVIVFDSLILSNSGFYDMFFVKYDASGNIISGYNAETNSAIYSLTADFSGNVYATGEFESSSISFGSDTLINLGGLDIFLSKLQISATGIAHVKSHLEMTAYPTICISEIIIQTENDLINATLKFYNLYGQNIKEVKNIFGPRIITDCNNLSSGIYFLHLEQNGEIMASEKIVVIGD